MRTLLQSSCNRLRRLLTSPRGNRPSRRTNLAVELLEGRAVPATFNVNSLADVSIAGGVNPTTGAILGQGNTVTLRSAIDAANMTPGGSTIRLTLPGTYKIALAGANTGTDATGAFAILPTGGNLTIVNASMGPVTVDANHLDRGFDINPNFDPANPTAPFTVMLSGIAVQNGLASDPANPDGPNASGGGIRDTGNASLTLNNVLVTGNTATADGGGIVMENVVSVPWTLTVNNSTISANHAGDAGGGIDTDGSGKVFINAGTVITGNTCVNQGGGIWLDAIQVGNVFQTPNLTVKGAIISNNAALTGPGGGIGNSGASTVTIISSTLVRNTSGNTGGGFGDQRTFGSLIVANSLVLNNTAVGDGGGIQEPGPITSVTTTEIIGNASGARGGGIFASGTTLLVQNSTIANNTAGGDTGTSEGGGGIELLTTGTGLAASSITNTTITGNRALNSNGVFGGGIDALTFPGDLTLLNDTINANFAAVGGGIVWEGITGSVGVENTILAGNISPIGVDALNALRPFTDLGGNLIGVAGDFNAFIATGTTQVGSLAAPLNPLLDPLGNYGGLVVGAAGSTQVLQTEALQPGSSAIGSGVLLRAPAFDERGVQHLQTTGINAGAVSAVVSPSASPTHVSTMMPLVSQKTINGVSTTIYNVNSTIDTHTPAPGTLTLRAAIDLANQTPGSKLIQFMVPGVYSITLPGANTGTNASGAFAILPSGGNVTIVNATRGAVTVNGNGLDRVFDVNPGADANFNDEFTVTLQGFTITGGIAQPGDAAAGSGGGIRDQGIASLTLNGMVVTGNLATADGGGISMENTVSTHWVLTVNNSIISANHAGDAGGGIETDGSSKVFVNGTVITGNTCVNQGAGIWLDEIQNANAMESAALTVSGSTITSNAALTGPGGGIGNAGNGAVVITGSTVGGNYAGAAGGGFADSDNQGTLAVTSSYFAGNVAVGAGGGIQEGGPMTTITTSEIDSNSSGNVGGGLFANGAAVTISRSTFANNTASGDGNGGGAIELQNPIAASITDATITGNRALNNAPVNAGAIDAGLAFSGTLTLVNDTINANFASNGGGIFWAAFGGSMASLQNTIVAGDFIALGGAGVDLNGPAGPFIDLGGNLIGVARDANCGFGRLGTQTGTLAQPLNPLLGPLGNNGGPTIGAPGSTLVLQTEAPLKGSPARGKGVKSGAPATDERGMPLTMSVSVGAVSG
jgi:hypothetical protein